MFFVFSNPYRKLWNGNSGTAYKFIGNKGPMPRRIHVGECILYKCVLKYLIKNKA